MDVEEFGIISGQAMSLKNDAAWKNVNARYPGFTKDISEFVWYLVDVKNLDFSDREIVDRMLVEFPNGIDIVDRVETQFELSSEISKKFDAVSTWLKAVFAFHFFVDSILDGSHLIPLGSISFYQHNFYEVKTLKEQNESLLRNISAELDLNEGVDTVPHKRMMSIYKLIVGIAEERFGFSGYSKRNTVSRICNILQNDRRLSADTVRSILEDASDFINK